MEPVETTDGRFLLDTGFAGLGRILIGMPHGDFVPLLDTREQTTSPAVPLENGEVALVLGRGNDQMLAIASTQEGRIVRRLTATKGRTITGLAASPDGKTLYFGADGRILILTEDQESRPSFVSVSADGGGTKEIHLDSSQSLAPVSVGSRALNPDGKMLINISPSDSWFYRVAVLDLATGRIKSIPVTYPGDTMSANWTTDGRVLSVGLPLRSHIWRFRMVAK
jgi:dipeptidyl aminopeptidase/acylaminoacyl peptidase